MEITVDQLTRLVRHRFFQHSDVITIEDDDLSTLITKLDELKCDIYTDAIKNGMAKLHYKVIESEFHCDIFKAKITIPLPRHNNILIHLNGSNTGKALYGKVENTHANKIIDISTKSYNLQSLDRKIKQIIRKQNW